MKSLRTRSWFLCSSQTRNEGVFLRSQCGTLLPTLCFFPGRSSERCPIIDRVGPAWCTEVTYVGHLTVWTYRSLLRFLQLSVTPEGRTKRWSQKFPKKRKRKGRCFCFLCWFSQSGAEAYRLGAWRLHYYSSPLCSALGRGTLNHSESVSHLENDSDHSFLPT